MRYLATRGGCTRRMTEPSSNVIVKWKAGGLKK